MSKRLFLRQIMGNPSGGGTNQLSPDEIRRSIISLQGGAVFGYGKDNKVILLPEDDAREKSPTHLSRCHARIIHTIDKGSESYVLQDFSENGTYINDTLLAKSEEKQLTSGDTIKFGNHNGSDIRVGEIATQTGEEIEFRVLHSHDAETSHLLDVAGRATVRAPDNKLPRVQQEEADSTNGNQEDGMDASSSRNDNDPQYPSTSNTIRMTAPMRTPKNKKFTDISWDSLTLLVSAGFSVGPFKDSFSQLSSRLEKKFRDVDPGTISTLIWFAILQNLETRDQFTDRISEVSTILTKAGSHNDARGSTLMKYRDEIARSLMFESDVIDELRAYTKALSEREDNGNLGFQMSQTLNTRNLPSFTPSDPSAFNPPKVDGLVAPTACYPWESSETWTQYCFQYRLNEKNMKAKFKSKQDADATMGSEFRSLLTLAANPFASATVINSYIDPVGRVLSIQKNPGKQQKTQFSQEVSVISSVPDGTVSRECEPSTSTAPIESSPDIDDERNTSSSSSAAVPRNRTESNASEIVDVVGLHESVAEIPIRRGVPPVEKLAVISPIGLMAELNGGTQTPSPIRADSEETKRKEEDTRKNIEKVSQSLQRADSPHVDDEAGPSRASSAHSHVQSPIPRPIAAASATPSVSSESHFKENIDKSAEEEEETDMVAPKEDQGAAELKDVGTSVKVVQKRTRKSASNQAALVEEKEKQIPMKLKRTMKQLDESGDSDSEEDDKTPQKKNLRRRSARTVKAGSPKKVKDVEEEDDEEDEEDDPETPKRAPRGSKSLKRSLNKSAGRRSKAGSVAADETKEPPKKKSRGRKKANLPKEEDSDVEAKNECGISKKWCCINGYERTHKFDPNWVQCQDCTQWYHVYCIMNSNDQFAEDESFSCCKNPSAAFERARNGHVHKEFLAGAPKDTKKSYKPRKSGK